MSPLSVAISDSSQRLFTKRVISPSTTPNYQWYISASFTEREIVYTYTGSGEATRRHEVLRRQNGLRNGYRDLTTEDVPPERQIRHFVAGLETTRPIPQVATREPEIAFMERQRIVEVLPR